MQMTSYYLTLTVRLRGAIANRSATWGHIADLLCAVKGVFMPALDRLKESIAIEMVLRGYEPHSYAGPVTLTWQKKHRETVASVPTHRLL